MGLLSSLEKGQESRWPAVLATVLELVACFGKGTPLLWEGKLLRQAEFLKQGFARPPAILGKNGWLQWLEIEAHQRGT